MPFNDLFNTYYDEIYKPALMEAGMDVYRADTLYASVPIIEDIRNGIIKADLLLADLTGKNPNVFYELGLAHAIGKSVILTVQNLEDLPFDLRHLRTIIYNTSRVDWVKKLHKDILNATNDFMTRKKLELFQLPVQSELIEKRKVELFRWEMLSTSEQTELYENFTKLQGRHHLPTRPLAPPTIQKELQNHYPIELTLLENLRKEFSPTVASLQHITRFPMSMPELLELRKLHQPITEGILSSINYGLKQSQALAFRQLYDYLCATEWMAKPAQQVDVDMIVVLGARRGHSFRADAAIQVANSAKQATIFLSGGQPIYDNHKEKLATEAEAMLFYIKNIRKVKTHKFIIDNRARTTLESAMHAVVAAINMAAELSRPVNIVIVTSSYHLRRTKLVFERVTNSFSPTIASLNGYRASSYIDWNTILKSENDEEGNDKKYAIGLYVLEYIKILGGRAAGEF